MENKHGLICPVPIEYWPDWAEYLTIDFDGSFFFEYEPLFNPDTNLFVSNRIKIGMGEVCLFQKKHRYLFVNENVEKCIWNRFELESLKKRKDENSN
jgi:hypothetical protein